MIKIKISAIALLVAFGITNVFFSIIPAWLGTVLVITSLIALVLLNARALRSGWLIKRLTIWADIILAIAIILFYIPATLINLIVTNYLILSLLLIFQGLLVAVLIKAYSITEGNCGNL